jgi:8-oxo-dGTP pyrophosphatase MutT (NUDIX family)
MSFSHSYYRDGVAAVVYRQDGPKIEYLLLHRMHPWKGWGLLKGKGKQEISTVEKELLGETNLKAIRIQKIPNLKIKYRFPKRPGREEHNCIGQNMQVYIVKVDPKAQVQVDFVENDDYGWVEVQKAKNLLKFENHKNALEIADRFITALIKNEL